MTEKRFEVTFNDSDFNLKDNETFEELRLFDEKVCYDYIADRWNALHEENKGIQDKIFKLLEWLETEKGVSRKEIKEWWNGDVE